MPPHTKRIARTSDHRKHDLGDEQQGPRFERSLPTEDLNHYDSTIFEIAKCFKSVELIPFFIADQGKLSITGKASAEEALLFHSIKANGETARLDQKAAHITARATKPKGQQIFRHLGKREETVLNALIYIANCSPGNIVELQGNTALKFTLGQIIHASGGNYKKAEIAEALDVLNGSITELRYPVTHNGAREVNSIKGALLPILSTVEDPSGSNLVDKISSTYFCTFHPVIAGNITALNIR